jgi:hypothetical protein
MCGRVIQSSGPLRLAIVEGLDVSDSRLGNIPRRYNAAPSQELLVIRRLSTKFQEAILAPSRPVEPARRWGAPLAHPRTEAQMTQRVPEARARGRQ